REIDWIPALRVVERGVVLRCEDPEHARRGEARQLAVVPCTRRIEVHATLDVVRATLRDERVDHRAHRRDLARRVWHHVGRAPTEATHVGEEFALLALPAIRGELERNGVAVHVDAYGQVSARVTRGPAKRSLALIAHTDHPAFEVTEAYGREGRARILGGLYPEFFAAPVPVLVCDD